MVFPNRDEDVCRRAFTLIELLTVIVIVALLATIALGGVKGVRDRVAIGRAKGELAALATALENYRRHYGDYPQTGAAVQAAAVVGGNDLAATDAQVALFNALAGVYGPRDFVARLSGPTFLEFAKFRLEDAAVLSDASWGIPVGSPPRKPAVANALLDPWGRRYLYFYRAAGVAGAQWKAPAYVLYSAGPDGAHVAPDVATGLDVTGARTAGVNADNLYADSLP